MENEPVESEVSEASVEDKLAAAFERAEKESEPQEAEEVQAEQETEPPDEESEDVEYEGKAYKLPKELKEALLRQQDYTKKTQEVAETRRVLEAQKSQIELQTKFNAEQFEKAAELQMLNRQLQQFSQVDWAKLAEENPAQYLTLDRQQRTLQDAANRSQAELQNLVGKYVEEANAARQKAQAQCAQELKSSIKDFGPDLIRGLDETGRSYGFTGEELAQVADPRMIRVLHDAMQYRKLQGSKALVDKKVAGKPVQLASARSTTSIQANAALIEAKAKAMKSGKSQDVQSFLEQRFAKSMRT